MTSTRSNTASGKAALGSVFGAVSSASSAVASLFGVATDSVGMLNKYVADAREKQNIASDYEMATFEEKLLDDHSIDEAKRNREMKLFIAEDPENRELLKSAHNRIKAAVAAR